jgi:hypothetical protein
MLKNFLGGLMMVLLVIKPLLKNLKFGLNQFLCVKILLEVLVIWLYVKVIWVIKRHLLKETLDILLLK